MSARTKPAQRPTLTADAVLPVARRAHAAAVAALRAVQLQDEADALAAEGPEPRAESPASRRAERALIDLAAELRRAYAAADEPFVERRRAIPDDMHRDDRRAVLDAERKAVCDRWWGISVRIDDARACVGCAGGARAILADPASRGAVFWLRQALHHAEQAIEGAALIERAIAPEVSP